MNVTSTKPKTWPTPPQLAKEWGVDAAKVVAFIKSGELHAVDMATRRGGRPRYRIPPEAISRFLESRSATPAPQPTRRKRARLQGVREYF